MDESTNMSSVKMLCIANRIHVLYLSCIHPDRDNFPTGYNFQISSKDFIS